MRSNQIRSIDTRIYYWLVWNPMHHTQRVLIKGLIGLNHVCKVNMLAHVANPSTQIQIRFESGSNLGQFDLIKVKLNLTQVLGQVLAKKPQIGSAYLSLKGLSFSLWRVVVWVHEIVLVQQDSWRHFSSTGKKKQHEIFLNEASLGKVLLL